MPETSSPAGAAAPASSAGSSALQPRVVVCGAGFGGLWAARALARTPVEVQLLDRNNYHTFLPLLYQVAAAELGPSDIAYPVRSILREAKHVRFRMAEVESVDLDTREVVTDRGRVPYDFLILALGSVPNFFGVEGAAEHAFRLRDMSDAIPLRHHILSRFEAAADEPDEERRRRMLTFVVVGGGPTGVEYAGALAELVYGPMLRDYPMLDREEARIVLIETMERLLLGMPERLGAYAAERLARRRVTVRTGVAAARVTAAGIDLGDGSHVPSETVIWTAGVKGDPRAEAWGLPVGKGGRVQVTPALHLEAHPEVYVVGDLALTHEKDGEALPQVAQVAMQGGERAAANVLRALDGNAPEAFHYRDYGMLAVIGRNAAVAELGGRTLTGLPAWVIWLVVHIFQLIGFRNRLLVLVNWGWNYLRFRRAVRLILPPVAVPEAVVGPDVLPELPDGSGERPP